MAMPSKRRLAGLPANSDPPNAFALTSDDSWIGSSACGQLDDTAFDLFFPDTKDQELAAKQICARCPVAWQCLDLAIRNQEIWGIWGGMTFAERCRLVDRYREHTSPRAKAAHRRHITELNRKQIPHADRAQWLRT